MDDKLKEIFGRALIEAARPIAIQIAISTSNSMPSVATTGTMLALAGMCHQLGMSPDTACEMIRAMMADFAQLDEKLAAARKDMC